MNYTVSSSLALQAVSLMLCPCFLLIWSAWASLFSSVLFSFLHPIQWLYRGKERCHGGNEWTKWASVSFRERESERGDKGQPFPSALCHHELTWALPLLYTIPTFPFVFPFQKYISLFFNKKTDFKDIYPTRYESLTNSLQG